MANRPMFEIEAEDAEGAPTMTSRSLRATGAIVAAALSAVIAYGEAECQAQTMSRLKAHFTPNSEHVFVTGSSQGSWQNGHYFCSAGQCWSFEFVVQSPNRPMLQGTDILSYYDPTQGRNHFFYVANSGGAHNTYDIFDVSWSDTCVDVHGNTLHGGMYCYNNSAGVTGTNVSDSGPAPYVTGNADGSYTTSSLTGFVSSGGILHVFYVSQSLQLIEFYRYNGTWFRGYPPGYAQATNGAGLASVWDGANERIYVTGMDNYLWEVAYMSGKGWQTTRITGPSPAPINVSTSASPQQFFSAVYYTGGGAGAPLIWGATPNQSLFLGELVSGTTWEGGAWSGLPNVQPNSPTLTMPNTGWPYYVGPYPNSILQGALYSPMDGTNLTIALGLEPVQLTASTVYQPQGTQYGPVTGGLDYGGTQHIFFLGADGYIHEMYGGSGSSGWSLNLIVPPYGTPPQYF